MFVYIKGVKNNTLFIHLSITLLIRNMFFLYVPTAKSTNINELDFMHFKITVTRLIDSPGLIMMFVKIVQAARTSDND